MDSTQRLANSLVVVTMVAALSACGGGGSASSSIVVAPVTIQTQPVDQTVTAAGTARFAITATGDSLAYQWELSTNNGANWTAIAGATQAALELAAVTSAQNGYQYRVVVSGPSGSVISSTVVLRITPVVSPPTIVVNVPASLSAVAGADLSLTVTASGTTPSYRWQVSTDGSTWADVPRATESTLVLTGVTVDQSGLRYRVIVTNTAGSVTSAVATLQVTAAATAPAVVVQPQSTSVVAPNAATFTVQGTGTPAPTIQWQRSTDAGVTFTDIAGATAATFSTGATTVSQNGQRFRAVLTNASGSATSSAAQLSVAAAAVAPAFSTQPLNATATAGSVATFTVVVSGSPAPAVQWQVSTDGGATFGNITGATAATYTTPPVTSADNGKRYRAVATNSAGTVNSTVVTLTVNAVASALSGRVWTTGQALETGDTPVVRYAAAIDDGGKVMVVFVKSDGARPVLWARLGTPNGAGTQPTWASAVALDAAAPVANNTAVGVAMSPAGNAVATWTSSAPCNSTSYLTSVTRTCLFRYAATFQPSTGQWSSPALVASTPSASSASVGTLAINDRGDLLVEVPGWIRRDTTAYTDVEGAVTWRAAGATAFRQQTPAGATLAQWRQHLDREGRIVVVGRTASATTGDIVAFRGTTASGLGALELLDQRGAETAFRGSWAGVNGQVVVMWSQSNGVQDTRFGVTLDNPTGTWSQPTELGLGSVDDAPASPNTPYHAVVSDDGNLLYYRNAWSLRRTAGVWSGFQRFSDWGYWNFFYSNVALNRDGSALVTKVGSAVGLRGPNGTATFDGPTQALIQAFPTTTSGAEYLLGIPTTLEGITLLSKSGIGAFISGNTFDVLPTPAAPAGDSRRIDNLWGFYFK